jgi:hypothetical protein
MSQPSGLTSSSNPASLETHERSSCPPLPSSLALLSLVCDVCLSLSLAPLAACKMLHELLAGLVAAAAASSAAALLLGWLGPTSPPVLVSCGDGDDSGSVLQPLCECANRRRRCSGCRWVAGGACAWPCKLTLLLLRALGVTDAGAGAGAGTGAGRQPQAPLMRAPLMPEALAALPSWAGPTAWHFCGDNRELNDSPARRFGAACCQLPFGAAACSNAAG